MIGYICLNFKYSVSAADFNLVKLKIKLILKDLYHDPCILKLFALIIKHEETTHTCPFEFQMNLARVLAVHFRSKIVLQPFKNFYPKQQQINHWLLQQQDFVLNTTGMKHDLNLYVVKYGMLYCLHIKSQCSFLSNHLPHLFTLFSVCGVVFFRARRLIQIWQ